MYNRVIQGDWAAVLKTLPGESVDFVLTDPPYFVRYKDRSGRTIRNDRYPGQILDAFNDVYRVLKPNSLCVSFYGWNRVDSFFSAWKGAGFTPAILSSVRHTPLRNASCGIRMNPPTSSRRVDPPCQPTR